MTRLWPRSLFSRLLWVWLLGLILVFAAAAWLAMNERGQRAQVVMYVQLTQDLAASADWLDTLNPALRLQWTEESNKRRARWRLAPPMGWTTAPLALPPHLEPLATYLNQEIPTRGPILRHFKATQPHERGGAHEDEHHPTRMRPQTWVSVTLADGAKAYARLPDRGPVHGGMGMAGPGTTTPWGLVALTVLLGLGLLTWLAVVYATRPLKRMTQAALDLAEHPNRTPLNEDGPMEVRQAAQAFNHMQAQIQRQMAQQTQVLAAIAHDIQTPMTRLRLKTEWVVDEALRQRMQADLGEMQDLVHDGLSLARSWHAKPNGQAVNLKQLLQAQLTEWEDLGWAVEVKGWNGDCLVNTDVQALRRVLGNVVHNAVTYGHRATVTGWCHDPVDPASWCIVVEDDGPGLPEDALKTVLEPFVRQETSRNRQTGGTGLGLTIAHNLMTALGGSLVLSNLPSSGLRVEIRGPRSAQL
jgi:signal transduction histidine kinase